MTEPIPISAPSRPEAIVVSKQKGDPGPPGPAGRDGIAVKYSGSGPPGVIVGAEPGDLYLDLLTGNLYKLT